MRDVRVASVYVPNGTAVGSERFAFKLAFLDRLRSHAAALLEHEEALIIGGDYNVGRSRSTSSTHAAGRHDLLPSGRAGQAARLAAIGLYDAYRIAEPRTQAYSWWDYQGRPERQPGPAGSITCCSAAGGRPARDLRDRPRRARRQGDLRPRAGVVRAQRP